MGLAYTIDTPVKVARYGIASVMSIGEDRLIEMMRKHYCVSNNKPYTFIGTDEPDYRARRITAYLDLVDEIVNKQLQQLISSPFETGSEITRYFQLLPEESPMKLLYYHMLQTPSQAEKRNMQQTLRTIVEPGSIDVNIMTKTDRSNFDKDGNLLKDGSDAVAALRGYAKSKLKNTAIVFSAGLNPRLFSYLENFSCFLPDKDGNFEKKITIKVSDYRSALIQGKFLAKKGIWVSEFRIESGLNCGGHAFATDGYLMGPILNEFQQKKQELHSELWGLYETALKSKSIYYKPGWQPGLKFTVQGGIGTAAEDHLLKVGFGMDSTGWGTPFLLVPEATTVDEATLKQLTQAKKNEVVLSHSSPLGVRYHYLKGTSAEKERLQRVADNKPGSPCTEKHLAFNTEFTKEPICTASKKYQNLKITDLKTKFHDPKELQKQIDNVIAKECLCIGLSNAASVKYNVTFLKTLKAVTICPGPNIVNFDRLATLEEMIGHIYCRGSILANSQRNHMFINELELYINYLKEELEKDDLKFTDPKKISYYKSFFSNLQSGVLYYRNLFNSGVLNDPSFISSLSIQAAELTNLHNDYLANYESGESIDLKIAI